MFVVAPSNGTVTILNDILFVTVPTQEQIKVRFLLYLSKGIEVIGLSGNA
jgi:hypothetical protein